MAVVVNEMEVVPAATETKDDKGGPGEKGRPKPLDPREILRIAAAHSARASRVRAH